MCYIRSEDNVTPSPDSGIGRRGTRRRRGGHRPWRRRGSAGDHLRALLHENIQARDRQGGVRGKQQVAAARQPANPETAPTRALAASSPGPVVTLGANPGQPARSLGAPAPGRAKTRTASTPTRHPVQTAPAAASNRPPVKAMAGRAIPEAHAILEAMGASCLPRRGPRR